MITGGGGMEIQSILLRADEVFLVSALRGLRRVRFVPE